MNKQYINDAKAKLHEMIDGKVFEITPPNEPAYSIDLYFDQESCRFVAMSAFGEASFEFALRFIGSWETKERILAE